MYIIYRYRIHIEYMYIIHKYNGAMPSIMSADRSHNLLRITTKQLKKTNPLTSSSGCPNTATRVCNSKVLVAASEGISKELLAAS